jgi:hypothetical protein
MRVTGWPEILAAKVEEWRSRPFQYGSSDCLQFVADVVESLTGVDHRARFPRYKTRIGAARITARMGGVEGILTRCLGLPKPVARAFRGDVIVIATLNGPTAGICLGVDCCFPGEPSGLMFRKTADASAAWSV